LDELCCENFPITPTILSKLIWKTNKQETCDQQKDIVKCQLSLESIDLDQRFSD